MRCREVPGGCLNDSGHCLGGYGVDSFDKNLIWIILSSCIIFSLTKQNQNSDPQWRVKEVDYSKNIITPMILIYSDSDFHL